MTIDTGRFHTLLLEERQHVQHGLEESSTRMLAAIDDSLRRIEDGTYGTCARCGIGIPVERLEAHPWASLCIDCKRESERG